MRLKDAVSHLRSTNIGLRDLKPKEEQNMKPTKKSLDEESYELDNAYNEDDDRMNMVDSSIWYN